MLLMNYSSAFRAHSSPGRKISSWRVFGLMCSELEEIGIRSEGMSAALDSSEARLRALWCVGSAKACEK